VIRWLVAVVLVAMATAHAAEPSSLAGRLLVATETMTDPRFVRTVIYMVEHDETGALGLIVNRPIAEVALSEVLRDMGRADESARGTIRVHFGGPVGGPRGFVLHTEEWSSPDTRAVGGGIAFTKSTLVVEAIARGAGPRRALFVLGYAGWAPRQLEAELARNVWITVTADEALIFDNDAATKWDRAMARRKITL
jgi:putative transcriptional regulator